MSSSTNTPKWMLGLGLAVTFTVISGCFLLPKEEEMLAPPLMEPPEITYEWREARIGTIVDDFRVTGSFVYTVQRDLSFRDRGGRLKAIYVGYGEQVSAGQLLAELDTDSLLYQINMQEINVEKARLNAERAALLGQDKIQQQISALDVRAAGLVLENYRNELNKARLFSPIDGVVVYIGRYVEGDAVDAYRTMVRVADPSVIQLSYKGIKSSDFHFGSEVEVSYDKGTYPGRVIQTPLTAPVDAPDSERNQILVDVEGLPDDVEAGDTAGIRVILRQKDNVIIIPRNLVQTYQGGDYVNILDEGIKVQMPVEKGIVTATEVEIVKGLSEGDKVIVR